ncbi:VOC family protein [Brevibacterium casei]|uniref:VOC family protein n=1 Tax=Brevibacterium casei TaxID=33889 RepID=A0A7T2WN13_9MICO|nr:VOC family protein [Brevibacterium casei]QPS34121.1 VOC family protein [Brevibacterium casei]
MPENAREGQPCWIDYVCQDFDGMKRFYEELFGWEIVDQGPDFGHYHIARKDGVDVAGFMRAMNMDDTPEPSMPTAWSTYLNTKNIDHTFKKAVNDGAHEVVGPMAVGPLGQMAVVVDPTGAPIGMWQADEFTGFETPLVPGTPVWFELMTTNYDAACEFYVDAFDFELIEMEGQDIKYATNGGNEKAVAGICDASQWVSNSYWRTYFNVADVDAATAKIVELGGKVLDGPEDSEFGRIATVADPEGATFQLHQDL